MSIVNHWGRYVDTDQPTTGVVSMNNLEWINEEIDAGVDLSYEGALKEFIEEKIAQWEEEHSADDDIGSPSSELIDQWTYEFSDLYEDNGESEYLIGDWVLNKEGKYELDHNGEYAAIALCGSNVVIVEWSKYATRCALCSPCYPGSGDLDTDGEFLAYDLPIGIYGEHRENTNAQIEYSAGAGSLPQ